LLTGRPQARAVDGIRWLKELVEALDIPPLSAYGITKADFEAIITPAQKANSMKGNPVELTKAELEEILEKAV
jgi:alcohol dehydrogenase class IV